MDNLVECQKCHHVWDGNAQCNCGLDYSSDEDNILNKKNELHKIILNLQTFLFINKNKIDDIIYLKIINDIYNIYNTIS